MGLGLTPLSLQNLIEDSPLRLLLSTKHHPSLLHVEGLTELRRTEKPFRANVNCKSATIISNLWAICLKIPLTFLFTCYIVFLIPWAWILPAFFCRILLQRCSPFNVQIPFLTTTNNVSDVTWTSNLSVARLTALTSTPRRWLHYHLLLIIINKNANPHNVQLALRCNKDLAF